MNIGKYVLCIMMSVVLFLLMADNNIAYISFLGRSAVDPKFCLLFVDLFTSKIYLYPMKKGNLLAKKMELFYKDIEKKKKDWAK